jgi:hypothetical protein
MATPNLVSPTALEQLAETQAWMLQALRFPQQTEAGSSERLFAGSENLSARAGLAIYQRAFFLRLADCMRLQFPALCHALGVDLFNAFVADYLRDHPPESHTLYDLGRRFAGYLEASRPDRAQAPENREVWIDFMVDLASFERQVFVLFDAPGHEGRPYANDETPDGDLVFQSCCALGAYRFPVAPYYHAVRAGNDPSLPPYQPTFIAMARRDYVTQMVPISAQQYAFLNILAQGGSFEDGFAEVAQQTGRDRAVLRQEWSIPGGARSHWVRAGILVPRG